MKITRKDLHNVLNRIRENSYHATLKSNGGIA